STAAAVTATALVALNPNLLYLQSTAMTEAIFFGCLMAVLYFTVRGSAAGAGIATCAATLTRFEGWFLVPLCGIYFALRREWRSAILASFLAALGPLYWMAHNWYLTGDALDFYRGPYSALAIQHDAPCPGRGDWRMAWLYYRTAVQLCAGQGLAV